MPRDGEGAAYVDQGNQVFDRLLLTAPTFASSSTRSATKSYKIDTAKSVKFVALRESVPGTKPTSPAWSARSAFRRNAEVGFLGRQVVDDPITKSGVSFR
jgi:hypothetical protein